MKNKTDNSFIRRILLVIVLILWIVILWLLMKSKAPVSAVMPDVLYKIRAYSTDKEKANSALKSGESMGLKGNLSRCKRSIKKYMGFIIEQDFSGETTLKKINYIKDLLESRGYKVQVIKEPGAKQVTVRIKDIYRDRKKAEKVAQEIYEDSTVTFNVKKYFKNSGYNAFMVIFAGIDDREKALELKQKISAYTRDIEMISY